MDDKIRSKQETVGTTVYLRMPTALYRAPGGHVWKLELLRKTTHFLWQYILRITIQDVLFKDL